MRLGIAEKFAELRVEEAAEMPANPPPNNDPMTITDPLSGAVPVPSGVPDMPGYMGTMNPMSPPPMMMPIEPTIMPPCIISSESFQSPH